MDVKEEHILGSKIAEHWYYKSKAVALKGFVADLKIARILDVGAGSGFFSRHLLMCTNATEAVCVDTSYTEEQDDMVAGKPIHFRKSIAQTHADLVLMMDVIEHVDDDRALLKEYLDIAPSGTHFFVTVPAFSFLWSEHDIFLGHRRRYTLKELEQVVALAGASVERSSYIFGTVFPIAVFQRLLMRIKIGRSTEPRSQLKQHWKITNHLLRKLCEADQRWGRNNKVAGLTAACLARKP